MIDDFDMLSSTFTGIIFKYPGALIRWPFYRGRMRLKELLSEKSNNNLIVGLIATLPLYVVFVLYLMGMV